MEAKILIATFELSDPAVLFYSGDETYRHVFPGTIQGVQGVLAGSIGTVGTIALYDGNTHFLSLIFTGTANHTIHFPDASGLVALERTGDFRQIAGALIPQGWLEADGTAVSRSTYAALFGDIGTTYGPGDGSTTFNLPNVTGAGRFLIKT